MSRFSISSHPGDKMLELLLSPFSCQFYPKFRPFSGQQLKNRVKFGHLSCHSYITELDIYLLVYKRISYIKLKFNFWVKFGPFLLKFHEISFIQPKYKIRTQFGPLQPNGPNSGFSPISSPAPIGQAVGVIIDKNISFVYFMFQSM